MMKLLNQKLMPEICGEEIMQILQRQVQFLRVRLKSGKLQTSQTHNINPHPANVENMVSS